MRLLGILLLGVVIIFWIYYYRFLNLMIFFSFTCLHKKKKMECPQEVTQLVGTCLMKRKSLVRISLPLFFLCGHVKKKKKKKKEEENGMNNLN
jgi:hypothetical protein